MFKDTEGHSVVTSEVLFPCSKWTWESIDYLKFSDYTRWFKYDRD